MYPLFAWDMVPFLVNIIIYSSYYFREGNNTQIREVNFTHVIEYKINSDDWNCTQKLYCTVAEVRVPILNVKSTEQTLWTLC